MQPTTVAITNTVFFVPRGLASGSTVLIVFDYVHCCRYQERLFGTSFALPVSSAKWVKRIQIEQEGICWPQKVNQILLESYAGNYY